MSTWPRWWWPACAMPPAWTWRAKGPTPSWSLAREALADERVNGDDYATGLLLDMYGSRLARTDEAAGLAAVEQSVALFERVGRPSVEHARAIGYLVMRRIFEVPRPEPRTTSWPGQSPSRRSAATWTRC